VIYVDPSVLLAQLLAEDRGPPRALWDEPLIASRLAEYEVWNLLHARGLAESHGEAARQLLARVAMVGSRLSLSVARSSPSPYRCARWTRCTSRRSTTCARSGSA
jgi:hypothetical protein